MKKTYDYDFLIVGGGPAGASFARELDNKYKTLLVDKRDLRGKPTKLIKNCGGLLAPDAQKALASFNLSIPKDILSTPQIFCVDVLDFDNNLTRRYQKNYINTDRELFDRWLIDQCDESIDKLFRCRFLGAKSYEEGWKVELFRDNAKIEVTTKHLIGADGANSRVKKLITNTQLAPQRYISLQEWFKLDKPLHAYTAIFDSEISDFYSWIIPKDGTLLFGVAIEEERYSYELVEKQKEKLKTFGFELKNPLKKEGCHLLRPLKSKEIDFGNFNTILLGEAAGLISPTSAEGISYAMNSGVLLAHSINEKDENFFDDFSKKSKLLKRNISSKLTKFPLIYNKNIRKLILKSNIGAI